MDGETETTDEEGPMGSDHGTGRERRGGTENFHGRISERGIQIPPCMHPGTIQAGTPTVPDVIDGT